MGIAARRQRELIFIITLNDQSEDAEWLDEEDINIAGLSILKERCFSSDKCKH